MAFGCGLTYGNFYGCANYYGAYNFDYFRCCSYGWTWFADVMMWVGVSVLILVFLICMARARQRRRMMMMQQMQMMNGQMPNTVIVQTNGPIGGT